MSVARCLPLWGHSQSEKERATSLRVVAQALPVKEGLEHAVLDKHQVCQAANFCGYLYRLPERHGLTLHACTLVKHLVAAQLEYW